jgi:hypothetical protein
MKGDDRLMRPQIVASPTASAGRRARQ